MRYRIPSLLLEEMLETFFDTFQYQSKLRQNIPLFQLMIKQIHVRIVCYFFFLPIITNMIIISYLLRNESISEIQYVVFLVHVFNIDLISVLFKFLR